MSADAESEVGSGGGQGSPVVRCPSCNVPWSEPGSIYQSGPGICGACGYVQGDQQNFAEHPPSISELRADRSEKASDWTPRDVLIQLLREIDSGSIVPTAVVVSMAVRSDDGFGHLYRVAAPDGFTSLGLLARAAHRLQEG